MIPAKAPDAAEPARGARGGGGARARPGFGKRALFLSIPYLLVALALLAIEAGARLALPHVTPLEVFVESQHQRGGFVDAGQVSIFEGDPLLFWRLKPGLRQAVWSLTPVTTNDDGVRYDGPLAAKPRGAVRVVCVGDSVTFGWRVPLASPDAPPDDEAARALPYPALLERSLRAANPGRQIEVVPLAVPGYSSHQGLAWLRRDIGRLRPDLVIILFGWNDAEVRAQTDAEAMTVDWLSVNARRLVAGSQALSHLSLWRRGRPRPQSPGAAPQTYSARTSQGEFAANVVGMARLAEQRGARVCVLVGPLYGDPTYDAGELARVRGHRDALRSALRRAGLPHLEVAELTEAGFPANRELFYERIHPNHEGHRLLAAALLNFLSPRRMLGDVTIPASLPEAE